MASTTRLTECVCVWHDAISEPDSPAWVVTHDHLDAGGGAEMTRTLDVLSDGDEDGAIESAREHGRRLGLPVYHRGEHARGAMPLTLIQPAPVED